MEAQPDQQPTNTRPQQPIDAYAATLPVETLTHIFELALEGFVWPDEEKGQAHRVKYGLVCRSWCSAALLLPRWIVASSTKAERLSDLLQSIDDSHLSVRSLDLTAEKDKIAGRGVRIARLLELCPNLERFTIMVKRELCAAGRQKTDELLGKPVQDALATLSNMREVEIVGPGAVPCSVLDR
jgi:hypothetical protein